MVPLTSRPHGPRPLAVAGRLQPGPLLPTRGRPVAGPPGRSDSSICSSVPAGQVLRPRRRRSAGGLQGAGAGGRGRAGPQGSLVMFVVGEVRKHGGTPDAGELQMASRLHVKHRKQDWESEMKALKGQFYKAIT